MTRYSSADDLITLPRMSAADAIALGTALEAAALAVTGGPSPQPLPATIAPKFQRMVAAREALADAARERMHSDESETPQSKAADQVLDRVWSGTRDLCAAYKKLPKNQRTAPLIESAEILWQAFFSDGLEFTKIKYRLQWVESKHRLDAVADRSLATHFNRLGAAIFLTELEDAQAAYGQALGLTETTPENSANIRPALTAFQSALKRYIAAAHGHADPDIPGSQEMIDKLLAPLNTWRSSSTTSPTTDDPESEDPIQPDLPVPEPV